MRNEGQVVEKLRESVKPGLWIGDGSLMIVSAACGRVPASPRDRLLAMLRGTRPQMPLGEAPGCRRTLRLQADVYPR